MIQITKKREHRAGLQSCWRLYANGHRTLLFIEKASERPRWGMTQEYDLCHDQLGFLKDGSVNSLITMAQACANPCGEDILQEAAALDAEDNPYVRMSLPDGVQS